MTKKRAEKDTETAAEVEYEHGLVEYETPVAVKPETPARYVPSWVRPNDVMVEHDCGCWCGAPRRIQKRCDGHPTTVRTHPSSADIFVCPAGKGITSPPGALIEAYQKQKQKGVTPKKKEKPNG